MGRTMKISKEDYLETILVCTKELGACRVTDVAAHLGHSKASVSVALSKLENEGLIIGDTPIYDLLGKPVSTLCPGNIYIQNKRKYLFW